MPRVINASVPRYRFYTILIRFIIRRAINRRRQYQASLYVRAQWHNNSDKIAVRLHRTQLKTGRSRRQRDSDVKRLQETGWRIKPGGQCQGREQKDEYRARFRAGLGGLGEGGGGLLTRWCVARLPRGSLIPSGCAQLQFTSDYRTRWLIYIYDAVLSHRYTHQIENYAQWEWDQFYSTIERRESKKTERDSIT